MGGVENLNAMALPAWSCSDELQCQSARRARGEVDRALLFDRALGRLVPEARVKVVDDSQAAQRSPCTVHQFDFKAKFLTNGGRQRARHQDANAVFSVCHRRVQADTHCDEGNGKSPGGARPEGASKESRLSGTCAHAAGMSLWKNCVGEIDGVHATLLARQSAPVCTRASFLPGGGPGPQRTSDRRLGKPLGIGPAATQLPIVARRRAGSGLPVDDREPLIARRID